MAIEGLHCSMVRILSQIKAQFLWLSVTEMTLLNEVWESLVRSIIPRESNAILKSITSPKEKKKFEIPGPSMSMKNLQMKKSNTEIRKHVKIFLR